ncbi:MAG: GGDEF domain-containing protein [Planctomycetes bacterium]|nr:GGDEF domain-containing protein [Planctomycetota bacterium]
MSDDAAPARPGRLTGLIRRIDAQDVRPMFQPILNLFTGAVLGYEVLSRAMEGGDSFDALVEKAKKFGTAWELERACRLAALRKIATLPEDKRAGRFFVNVSPEIFRDPRFVEGFTLHALREYGVEQSNIVIEITERESIADYAQFEQLIAHYTSQGFSIALDDFGSGHSGLVTLMSSRPHFLKLDMALTRDVHINAYKQHLVRSLVALAASVDAKLIAEGVEVWEELETLVKLGVRYGQGYLFARPQPAPPGVAHDILERLPKLTRRHDVRGSNLDESVGRMAVRCTTCGKGSINTEQLVEMFRKNPSLDHLVLLNGERPYGLFTREHLYSMTGWRFGYSLFQKRPVEMICKRNVLCVQGSMDVISLAKLAMDRMREDLYDPVVVIDERQHFVGTVTIKQLVTRAAELQVQSASGASPLTGLPGNRIIQKWIGEMLERGAFTFIYGDLDHFKEFNDAYGFVLGDELIRMAGQTLVEHAKVMGEGARVGHIGGDDFVVVCPDNVAPDALQAICTNFDKRRLEFFKREDRDQGYYFAEDRLGTKIAVPLTTLSLAVITSDKLGPNPHPAMLSQFAASLKKKAKRSTATLGRSAYIFEQRQITAAAPEVEAV